MGGKLIGDEPKWQPFGSIKNPAAEIGFAIAAPVLRMQEGTRKVNLSLTLSNVDGTLINDARLKGAFDLYLTGEKSWIGPYVAEPTFKDNVMSFSITVPASEKAIVDYDVSIHGYRYTTASPVIQLLLKTGLSPDSLGYSDFEGIKIQKARITVEVSDVTSLSLKGQGTNPKNHSPSKAPTKTTFLENSGFQRN